MRIAKVLSNTLGMKRVRVRGCDFSAEELLVDVAPTTRIARCCGCGCRARRVYDHWCGRLWRHVDFGGMKVELRYDLRHVECRRCGLRTEMAPWAEPDSTFTRGMRRASRALGAARGQDGDRGHDAHRVEHGRQHPHASGTASEPARSPRGSAVPGRRRVELSPTPSKYVTIVPTSHGKAPPLPWPSPSASPSDSSAP